MICDMNSLGAKQLTTLRVNFSKEVRRPCSVSAGCCFGEGMVGGGVGRRGQGECFGSGCRRRCGQRGGGGGGRVDDVSEGSIAEMMFPGTMWWRWSGIGDEPVEGAVFQ